MAQEQNKNYAKRVPKSAVFTLRAEDDTSATPDGEPFGMIEGNIAITRVTLIVEEAFEVSANLAALNELSDGVTTTWFAGTPLDSLVVVVADLSLPAAGGTVAPIYRPEKSLWAANLTTAGNTVDGQLKIVVEYIQLDTEPGLHSATTK